MSLSEMMASELEHEAATTRRMLERVPDNLLAWKPHEKSMALGQLSAHFANILNKWFRAILSAEEFDLAADFKPPRTDSVAAILEAFDENIQDSIELLRTQTDEQLFAPWRLKQGEKVLFELPRWAVIRSMIINHIIHHRGQLSVYLRLHDIPLPAVYGPTADEAPVI
jgi:uncharacterized damage-inducible protein DinB